MMNRLFTSILTALDDCPSAGRFGIVIGVWCAMLAGVVNIRSISNDNIPNVLIPASLVREGNVELSEYDALMPARPGTVRYWAVVTPAGVYSRYPIWAGVAAAPVFAPAVWLLGDPAGPGLGEAALLRIGRLAGLGFCGLYAGVMATLLRRFVAGRWAAGLTVLSILATTMWHQIGASLSTQTLPVVCIAGTLAAIATDNAPSRGRAWLAGLLAGLAVAARPPALFAAACPLGILFAGKAGRRALPWALLGAAVFPILTLAYNAHVFGGPLATGYGEETAWGFSAFMPEGALGLLVSPTCGLLVYSPFLVAGPVAAMLTLRQGVARMRPLAVCLLIGFAGQWLLFSRWWAWNGALTFGGPRMLAETIPTLVLLIAMHWQQLAQGPVARRLFVAAGVYSVIVFLAGTSAFDAVAPLDPPKPDWDLRVDIVGLYVRQFGIAALVGKMMLNAAMLAAVLTAGGWLASRFCSDVDRVPETQPA